MAKSNSKSSSFSTSRYDQFMDFSIGDVQDDEMVKQDFRKAMTITALSVISSLAITIVLYLI